MYGDFFDLGLKYYGLQECPKLPHIKVSMKCLSQELKFSKWLLPHEDKRCSVEIMVFPLFLLKHATYIVWIIIPPMGTFNSCPTLQTKLPMNIETSAIYGSKNQ